jgi:UDP-glucose 6-dehydrogenase
MKTVLIVGVGNIGSRLYREYGKLAPDRYDPYKGFTEKKDIRYDFAFLATDTPMNENGTCDLSQVRQAIDETDAEVFVLRSTVPPGTTERLKAETGKRIVFSPEFYGTTQHCDEKAFDFSFTILGGQKEDCNAVIQLLQEVYDGRHRFRITDSKTAELTKYMENTILAARVSLCVQFWEIAKQYGVSYPEMRELLLCDERFSRAHTFVYDEHPYWESHCFDKDLSAIASAADAPLIEGVIRYNEQCKARYGVAGKLGNTE